MKLFRRLNLVGILTILILNENLKFDDIDII